MTTDLEPYRSRTELSLPERLGLPEILETAKILAASGYFPTAREAGQAAAMIMWGQDMGLTPMQAMTGIHVWVQGGQTTMQVSANAIAFLLKRHGFTWTFIQHDADACEVEIYRRGTRLEPNIRFTKEQAAKAQLANKPVWQGYAEDMLWNRVVGRIARRFAPEIFDAASVPVVTTEEAEDTYPDPRDDIMRALHAAYRDIFPKGADETAEEYREGRLSWSEDILDREVGAIPSWNGPTAPETLTRADVQVLFDELERLQPAPAREQEAPDSSGAPNAAGADHLQSSAPDVQFREAGPEQPGAEHHQQGSAGPASRGTPGSAGRSSDPANSAPPSTTPARWKGKPPRRPRGSAGGQVGEQGIGAVTTDTPAQPMPVPPPNAPSRRPAKLTAGQMRQHQKAAEKTRSQDVNPLQWLSPDDRVNLVNFCYGKDENERLETATRLMRNMALRHGWTDPMTEDQLKQLRSQTFGRKP